MNDKQHQLIAKLNDMGLRYANGILTDNELRTVLMPVRNSQVAVLTAEENDELMKLICAHLNSLMRKSQCVIKSTENVMVCSIYEVDLMPEVVKMIRTMSPTYRDNVGGMGEHLYSEGDIEFLCKEDDDVVATLTDEAREQLGFIYTMLQVHEAAYLRILPA